MGRVAGLVALLVVAAACARPARQRFEEELERTSAPSRHAVYDARLRQLMGGLERLTFERLPQAMDEEGAEGARRAELAAVAQALAGSAGGIPQAAGAAELDPAERREFLALAEALRQRAQRLADEAQQLSVPELRLQLRGLERSCEDCHQRFRVRGEPDGD